MSFRWCSIGSNYYWQKYKDAFCNSNFRCRQIMNLLESLMWPKNVLSHCEMVTYLLGNVRRPELCIMPSLKKLLREHPVYILSLLFNEEKVSERDYVIKNLRSDVVLSYTIIESIFGTHCYSIGLNVKKWALSSFTFQSF